MRGKKITTSTLALNGNVTESPKALLAMAQLSLGRSIDPDAYALARMIRSEGASEGELRAHVAINDLADLGWNSLLSLLTYSTKPWAKGSFGRQFKAKYRTPGGGETWDVDDAARKADGKPVIIEAQSRRYATSKDPYESDLLAAERVLQARRNGGADPTNGAVKFLDISAFGSQEGTGSAQSVIDRWTGDGGLVAYTIPSYGEDFVLFRRA